MLCAQELVVGVSPPENSSKVKPPTGNETGLLWSMGAQPSQVTIWQMAFT